MSEIRLNDVPPKAGKIINTTNIATEDINDATGKTRKIPASDIPPYTWGGSDDFSPLATGILYTTEAISVTRSIKEAIVSLTKKPLTNIMFFDFLKETATNSNIFATIFSTLPSIMVGEFTSQTSFPPPIISDNVWEKGRRMQLKLVTNDFDAAGVKGTIKS